MVILGRQGSGKGTQSLRLAAQYGCVHLSTGDVLRAAVEEGTDLGQQAAGIMNAGGLVGDDVMIPLVAERVAKPDIMSGGVLLDGFPRTADQANGLEAMLAELGQELTIAINLDVHVEEVTTRMMARGREDDTEEAIARRLSLYEEQTAPLLDWFAERGLLAMIDGLGEEEQVFSRLTEVIDGRMA
ncbi:MAG: adenylate kinase [Acidimicrobiaceae bacterium]|jgi:adenylate kinase|nr:adenylate kinase [Acidimicrobiaceae bacterium]